MDGMIKCLRCINLHFTPQQIVCTKGLFDIRYQGLVDIEVNKPECDMFQLDADKASERLEELEQPTGIEQMIDLAVDIVQAERMEEIKKPKRKYTRRQK